MTHLIFDGHNDAISRLWCGSTDPVADFDQPIGHVNVPAAAKGGLGGGFFALFSPTKRAAFDFTAFEKGNLHEIERSSYLDYSHRPTPLNPICVLDLIDWPINIKCVSVF